MDNYCAYSNNHKCLKWTDYELTRYELTEADTLCHDNWIELQKKENYIRILQKILAQNGIEYPAE